MSPYRILLVEPYASVREEMRAILALRPEYKVVAEVLDGRESVRQVGVLQPDVILLGSVLPGMSALEVARRVHEVCPDGRIIFVSQSPNAEVVAEALRQGVLGWVDKKRLQLDLLSALEAVCQGRQFVSGGTIASASTIRTMHLNCWHEVEFYASDATLLENLIPFIANSLKAGNHTFLVATQSHREAIDHRLKAMDLDCLTMMREGRYVSLDAVKMLSEFMNESGPDRVRFLSFFAPVFYRAKIAAQREQKQVVAFGEMVAILCAQGRVERLCSWRKCGMSCCDATTSVCAARIR